MSCIEKGIFDMLMTDFDDVVSKFKDSKVQDCFLIF